MVHESKDLLTEIFRAPDGAGGPWWRRAAPRLGKLGAAAWRGALDWLLPPRCPLCREDLPGPAPLCPSCHEQLVPAPENLCLRCGDPASGPVTSCRRCRDDPWSPDACYFAYSYLEPLTRLIVALKFEDSTELAAPLGELMWAELGSSLRWEEPDLVVPVPLHTLRLLQRGYNQSALLAGVLARRLQRPLVTNSLVRIKMTPAQTRLEPRERWGNQRDAFRVLGERVAGQAVLLVDDVITTGATTRSAVAVLKQAGARRVALAGVARAMPRRKDSQGDQENASHRHVHHTDLPLLCAGQATAQPQGGRLRGGQSLPAPGPA